MARSPPTCGRGSSLGSCSWTMHARAREGTVSMNVPAGHFGVRLDGCPARSVCWPDMGRKTKDKKDFKRTGKHKLSERVLQFAGDFIHQGETLQERQIRLITASTVWNIANRPADERQKITAEMEMWTTSEVTR